MSRVITGGPAFPGNDTYIDGYPAGWRGMDLRDWFAGKVLSNMDFKGETPARAADWAYSVADAMLAEKAKAEAANRAADKEEYGDDLPF